MDIIKDTNGKISAKRVAGFVGLFGLLGLSVFGIIVKYPNVENLMWPLAIMIGGLFGVSVAEKKKG